MPCTMPLPIFVLGVGANQFHMGEMKSLRKSGSVSKLHNQEWSVSSSMSHGWSPSSRPRAHVAHGLVGWVSGVATFSPSLWSPTSCSRNLYLVASLFIQWRLVAPPFDYSFKFRSGTHWWCLKAPISLPTYLNLNV